MFSELLKRDFYKKTLIILLPVVLQQLITIGVNFFDNIMVGSFGEIQISSVAFGNQFYAFFQFICMGLGSGAIVMSSQFWGRKETGSMRTVAAIALRLTFFLCVIFTLISLFFPSAVLRFFTDNQDIITTGAPYIRIIALTFIPCGLASTATYLMRSVGNVKVALVGSLIAFILNIFFNWVFIFGKLGAPALELLGAGIGTLIARLFEFVFIFGYFILKNKEFSFRIKHVFLSDKILWKKYVRYSLPVLISDTSLGLSIMLTFVIVGHLSEAMSSASAIVASVVQILTVLNYGISGAAGVVVGNTIGSGDIPKAKREGNAYVLLSFAVGLIAVPILLLFENFYLGLYSITETTTAIAHDMIHIVCFMMPIQTVAYVTSKGLLRGGGDTRFVLLADSTLVWLISLPLGALAGFLWHMSPAWIYFFLRVEYPLKGIVCFIRFCTGKWIKVIKSSS